MTKHIIRAEIRKLEKSLTNQRDIDFHGENWERVKAYREARLMELNAALCKVPNFTSEGVGTGAKRPAKKVLAWSKTIKGDLVARHDGVKYKVLLDGDSINSVVSRGDKVLFEGKGYKSVAFAKRGMNNICKSRNQ